MSILRFKDKDDNWVSVPSLVGPPGEPGPQGEPGPNLITGDTATTLDGILKSNGGTVRQFRCNSNVILHISYGFCI